MIGSSPPPLRVALGARRILAGGFLSLNQPLAYYPGSPVVSGMIRNTKAKKKNKTLTKPEEAGSHWSEGDITLPVGAA